MTARMSVLVFGLLLSGCTGESEEVPAHLPPEEVETLTPPAADRPTDFPVHAVPQDTTPGWMSR